MAKRTLQENINQVINDLNEIKSAIETKGVEVPAGTPTRDYGDKILEIEGGIDTSADTVTPESLRAGFTAHDAQGRQIEGVILTYDNTMVAAPSKENFFGKWYFNETIDLSIVSGKMILEFSHPFVYGDTHNAGRIRLNEKGSPLNPYSYATIDYVDGTIFKVYGASGGWDYEGYRNVDFGTTPFEIDETWYEFFTTNATYVGNIMALNTAKKYCENNIDVSPIYNEGIAAGINSIPRYDGSIMSGATPGAQAKYEEGVEAGKKSEYDAFWDAFQDYGNRTNYNMAFAGASWTPEILKPKYPIHPNDGGRAWSYEGARIFERFGKKKIGGNALFDWKEITANMDIDLSSVSHPSWLFANANITNIDVDLSGAASMSQTFAHSDCGCTSDHDPISIRFKVTEKCVSFTQSFGYSSMLTELILTDDSIIAGKGFDVSWSPLSKASLMSIVNALSTTTTGLTVTLRLDAVNTAFETSEGAADGSTSEEWLDLAATKPNWTINLINS